MVSRILENYDKLLYNINRNTVIRKSIREIGTKELRVLRNINNDYNSLSNGFKYDKNLSIHEMLIIYNIFIIVSNIYPMKYGIVYMYYKNQSIGYRCAFEGSNLSAYIDLEELERHIFDNRLLHNMADKFFTFICFIIILIYIPICFVCKSLRL